MKEYISNNFGDRCRHLLYLYPLKRITVVVETDCNIFRLEVLHFIQGSKRKIMFGQIRTRSNLKIYILN